MSAGNLDRTLWPAVAALVGVFALFEVTTLDLWVQDTFFDFAAGRWMVDRDEPVGRLLFYTGPKVVIIVLGIALLATLVRPPWALARRDIAVALLCLGAIPTIVGWGKATTNVFCPWDIARYGGDVPYVRVLERFPEGQRPARRGGGFPAGHASGGFALFGLAGLARTRRGQWAGIAAGLAVGGAMGLYQMAKGAHYLSHTLVTALFAWIVFLVLRRLLARSRRSDEADGWVRLPYVGGYEGSGAAGQRRASRSRRGYEADDRGPAGPPPYVGGYRATGHGVMSQISGKT